MKKVLVTGGTRGIGKAIAELLSANFEVYAPGSQEMDVANITAINDYLQDKEIDILINNAGIYIGKDFMKYSEEDWQKIMDINLIGTVRVSQAVLPNMIKKNWGRIVNISSISGLEGEAYGSAYSASKFAMIGLTKSLAEELAKNNITVNAICPGWVRTDMTKNVKEEMILGSVLQKRWIEPIEVAEMAKYLISDGAQAVTGQAMSITAGLDL